MKSEGNWIRITSCQSIPLREGRTVRVGKRDIAIFNLGNRFLAVTNRCPHQGGPLSDGIVAGNTVVCPLHGWKIDLEDGAVKRPGDVSRCVETFATRVENGTVLLQLPASADLAVNIEEPLAAICMDGASRHERDELPA